MSKTVTIPSYKNPFDVEINGVKYSYKAGATVSVPDEVAALIEANAKNAPQENDPTIRLVTEIGENPTDKEVATAKATAEAIEETIEEKSLLTIPTITISLSQVISQVPLKVQLTSEQAAIVENDEYPFIKVDMGAFGMGAATMNKGRANNGNQFYGSSIGFGWGGDDDEVNGIDLYTFIYTISDKTAVIAESELKHIAEAVADATDASDVVDTVNAVIYALVAAGLMEAYAPQITVVINFEAINPQTGVPLEPTSYYKAYDVGDHIPAADVTEFTNAVLEQNPGSTFVRWADGDPTNYEVTEDKTFTALFTS